MIDDVLIKEITVVHAHLPDVTTFAGLCDVMMVGNLCEFGVLMQRRFYEGGDISEDDIEETRMARWRYRQFQTWFQSEHVLVIKGKCYEPMAAFRRSLIEFTAAVCRHKHHFNEKVPHHNNFTGKNIVQVLRNFLKLEYPELVKPWRKLSKQNKGWVFYWNGPRFEVRSRSTLAENTGVLDEFEDDSDDVVDASKAGTGRIKRKRVATPG